MDLNKAGWKYPKNSFLYKYVQWNTSSQAPGIHGDTTYALWQTMNVNITVFVYKKTPQATFKFRVNKCHSQSKKSMKCLMLDTSPARYLPMLSWLSDAFLVCFLEMFLIFWESSGWVRLLLMWAFSLNNLDWTWYMFLFRWPGTWARYHQASSTPAIITSTSLEKRRTSIPVSFSEWLLSIVEAQLPSTVCLSGAGILQLC